MSISQSCQSSIAEITTKLRGKFIDENSKVLVEKLLQDLTKLSNSLCLEREESFGYVQQTLMSLDFVVSQMIAPTPDIYQINQAIHHFRDTARDSQFSLETKQNIYRAAIALGCFLIVTGMVIGAVATSPFAPAIGFALIVFAAAALYYREDIVGRMGWKPVQGTFFSFTNHRENCGKEAFASLQSLLSHISTPASAPVSVVVNEGEQQQSENLLTSR